MIFRREHGPANVTSPVERRTRYAVLFKNNDRRSKPLMDWLIDLFCPLPAPARQSMTFDCGLEFVSWRELATGMGTNAWFCDAQAPWQKGSVGNLNIGVSGATCRATHQSSSAPRAPPRSGTRRAVAARTTASMTESAITR